MMLKNIQDWVEEEFLSWWRLIITHIQCALVDEDASLMDIYLVKNLIYQNAFTSRVNKKLKKSTSQFV